MDENASNPISPNQSFQYYYFALFCDPQGRTFKGNLGGGYVLGPTFVVFVFDKKSQLI